MRQLKALPPEQLAALMAEGPVWNDEQLVVASQHLHPCKS